MASISSSLRLAAGGVVALALLCACGGGQSPTNPAPDNPAPPANPVPSISSLTPAGVAAGSPTFTLLVAGSDFVASSTVNWNSVALPTTYVSASQLTAAVPAADVENVGDPNVTVISPAPGGGTSNAASFTINASNPVPSISSLSPASAAAGNSGFTLTVSGSDFVTPSTVNWNGVPLTPPTYVSASKLTVLVPASDITTVGTAEVTVINPVPGGGTSNTAVFTIDASNPLPSIASLSPDSAASGNAGFTLTVSGSDFVASSTVNWNAVPLTPPTYVSASKLTVSVPASDITTVGTADVTVFNPAPGGGTSNAATFSINASNPLPSTSSLSPNSVASGSTAFTLTVDGSDFVASSTVNWNGVPLKPTTFVSASKLTVLVPASDITTAGTASVTVFNPAPGGGTSNAETFTINPSNPVPEISSLSPTSTTAGDAAFTLTVDGSDFVASSTVNWNGVALKPTTYVSASKLTVSVPASDITTAGTASVTVVNPGPGGGTSNPEPFNITASGSGASVRQSGEYKGSSTSVSSKNWIVTLPNVLAGSTIYVVGMWPNFVSTYPTMGVTDGTNTYTRLDRHDDLTTFNFGIQGTQSMGHWYAANVAAGTYTINMAPTGGTSEDWVGVAVFEITGVSATPLDGHTLNFQASIPPGTNTVSAVVTNSGSSGIQVTMTFDDIDATAPTVPLPGTGFIDLGPFWNVGLGGPSARAESKLITSTGAHTATFSPQEGGAQSPDYMTTSAIFH